MSGPVARITWRIRNPAACRTLCQFSRSTCTSIYKLAWPAVTVCVTVYFPAADAVKCVDVFPFPSFLLQLQCNVMKCVCIKMQFEVQSYNIIMPCWRVTMCWLSECQCVCVCPGWARTWPKCRSRFRLGASFALRFMCAKWAYKNACMAAQLPHFARACECVGECSSTFLWILKFPEQQRWGE